MPSGLALVAPLLAVIVSVVPLRGSTVHAAATGVWPLGPQPRQVVGPYDPPARDWLAGHRGVDLAAVLGEVVLAPIAGTVEHAGLVVDRPVVVIRAGDLRVSLEPVSASLSVGDRVEAGARVGVVSAGRSHCAPAHCLHWGLRVGGEYRNPLYLVQRYQAVLLP